MPEIIVPETMVRFVGHVTFDVTFKVPAVLLPMVRFPAVIKFSSA